MRKSTHFEAGGYYRYIQQDCAGMHVPGMDILKSSPIVQYVGPILGSCDMHYVICPYGQKYRVEAEELVPIVPRPCDAIPNFTKGDLVMCMDAEAYLGFIFKHTYTVLGTNALYHPSFIYVGTSPEAYPLLAEACIFELVRKAGT